MTTARFWRDNATRYNLMATRCGSCGKVTFPPRHVCPICHRRSMGKMEKFRLSVEHSGDSVFWVNREGRILYTNASAWKTLGYKREEILNISIFDLDPDLRQLQSAAGI